jgi:hypothetical protein
MRRTVVGFALVLLCGFCCALPAFAAAPVVTLTGALVDRQCSVEDVFQLQPQAERYCTLTIEETTPSQQGTFRRWTVYCPNKAADGQPFNGAYYFCSDPAAMQIRHPNRTMIVQGWLRTPQQQADGLGQVQGYQFQY